jgi:hypothetical protein
MSVALIGPARAMLIAPGRTAFWRPLRGAGDPDPDPNPGSTFTGPYPDTITGPGGWWDAGSFAGMLDAGGHALPAWNNAVASVADKSGAGDVLTAYRVSGSTLPQATPRLNGLIGGVGLNTIVPPAMPQAGEYLPKMDGDSGLRLASANLGAATNPAETQPDRCAKISQDLTARRHAIDFHRYVLPWQIEHSQRVDILEPTAMFLLLAKDERGGCNRAGTHDRLQCDHDRQRAKLLPGAGLPLPKLVDAALPPEKLNPGVPDLVVVGVILQHEIGSDIGLRSPTPRCSKSVSSVRQRLPNFPTSNTRLVVAAAGCFATYSRALVAASRA